MRSKNQRKNESDEDFKIRIAAVNKAWNAANREKIRAAWFVRSDVIRDRERAYRDDHRVHSTARAAAWDATHPEWVVFRSARRRAQKRGWAFTLSGPLPIPEGCEVCGVTFVSGIGGGKKGGTSKSPSYDCVIPQLRYVEGNVRVICSRCNRIKNNATAAELRAIADYIERHTKSERVTGPPANESEEKPKPSGNPHPQRQPGVLQEPPRS